MNTTTLNPRIVNLYGWEQFKSDKVVLEMERLIQEGVTLPPIRVEMINEGNYQIAKLPHPLDNKRLDGGHHRALGYFYLGKEIPCELIGRRPNLYEGAIKIQDIILIQDNLISNSGIYSSSKGIKIPITSLEQFKMKNSRF